MVYDWKVGCRLSIDAQKVGEELETIECKDAVSVEKAARKSKSALHDAFEWDDTKAAYLHRLEQARYLLRMLVTVIDVKRGDEVVTITPRAYESVRFADDDGEDEKTMTYVPTREVLADPLLRTQVMGRLSSTIAEAERTAETYEYLCPAFGKSRVKLAEAREALRE